MADGSTLRILHCLRAPVGGLFRHVLDLAEAQAGRGHEVGIFADANAQDALTDEKFSKIEPHLALGIHRFAMSRKPGFGDVAAARQLYMLARRVEIDVLHGHGAKGGAFARLAGQTLKVRGRGTQTFYTPHGGSLHFDPKTVEGGVYLTLEKFLARYTDGLIFESAFAHDAYQNRIGLKGRATRIVSNGLQAADFGTHRPAPDATDFLFIGELRHLKGVDVLLQALAILNKTRRTTARIVGGGPDRQTFVDLAATLGVTDQVTFPGPEPAKSAFLTGRFLVVPSRAESFPYVVLEAGAVAMPLIATDVGGIPEMTQDTPVQLIPPNNVPALVTVMQDVLQDPGRAASNAHAFQKKIRQTYTVDRMAEAIIDFYVQDKRAGAH